MPRVTTARRSSARSILWLLSLACAYVLVGTWAFTPRLARESLAREVSAAAVPSRGLKDPRQVAAKAGRPSRDHGEQRSHRRLFPAGFAEAAAPPAAHVAASPRAVAPSSDRATHDRPANRAPYDATPPPAAR